MAKKTTTPAIDDEPIVKAEDDSEEGEAVEAGADDEEMDEEDEEDEDAEKSDLTEATLVKALDEMDSIAIAAANGVDPRERELAAKLGRGEPLTKSERAELAAFGEQMVKSHKESFVEQPQIAQGFEVSEFLDAALSKVAEALDASRADMTKSFAEVGEFNRALAKSLNALGAVVIAQDKKIRALESLLKSDGAPAKPEAAPAKGATGRSAVGQKIHDGGAIRKSGSGGDANVNLGPGAILGALDELIEKSEGKAGVVDGVDLVLESTRYESTRALSPEALRLVCKARNIDPTTLGLSA